MTSSSAVAVFGGTFNPIHFGHLRSALELLDSMPLEQIRFVPAALPPHREAPEVGAEHRAAMVEAAIADEPRFICDRRELHRDGPSYTYHTLQSLRAELGASRSLALIMGCDALRGLPGWYRWEELLNLAHIVVVARPGWSLPEEGPVAELLAERAAQPTALLQRESGAVVCRTLRPWEVSSTAIRALLQSGRSVRHLLPESVLDYIEAHGLYRPGTCDQSAVSRQKE